MIQAHPSFGKNGERGLALLITLSLLSILVVLVFSSSHQGTLEAQQRHQWEHDLRTRQLDRSAQHAIAAFLQSWNPQKQDAPAPQSFSIDETQFEAEFFSTGSRFNLNDLRNDPTSETLKSFSNAIKKSRLQTQRQAILDVAQQQGVPMLSLAELAEFLSDSERDGQEAFPYMSRSFSVWPSNSMIVLLKRISDDEAPSDMEHRTLRDAASETSFDDPSFDDHALSAEPHSILIFTSQDQQAPVLSALIHVP